MSMLLFIWYYVQWLLFVVHLLDSCLLESFWFEVWWAPMVGNVKLLSGSKFSSYVSKEWLAHRRTRMNIPCYQLDFLHAIWFNMILNRIWNFVCLWGCVSLFIWQLRGVRIMFFVGKFGGNWPCCFFFWSGIYKRSCRSHTWWSSTGM